MSILASAAPDGGGMVGAIDPRARILAATAFAAVTITLHSVSALLAALAVAAAVMVAARLPAGRTLKRMAMMDGFIVFMLVMLPFTVPGEPAFTVFGVAGSCRGLEQAVVIGLRANAVILCLMALVGSMEPTTLGHALARLRVPVPLVHLLLFVVRYIDVIFEEYRRLCVSMKVRGFRPANTWHTYRTFGYLVGMLLVRSMERSERILMAMKCRGFTGRLVLFDDMAYGPRDGAFALAWAALLAGLIVLETGRAAAF